ncbi:MAG: UPF0280 family protein [Candidatus Acidiferrales bacterium]
MRQPPTIQFLPDGRRLHMSDGPIDLIVQAFGDSVEIQEAYRAAAARFPNVLDELCGELSLLRLRAPHEGPVPDGSIARRMLAAVIPFASRCFITPMAAVAGAVAEEILESMTSAAELSRAYVNDGGDIAVHLSTGQQLTVGMVNDRAALRHAKDVSLFGTVQIDYAHDVRGIATSGWRGRSFSLGIADTVTVLARRAAMADAAATVIANAIDLPGNRAIFRVPARDLAPDSDLGDIPVTRDVRPLNPTEISDALESGARVARELLYDGLICAAALHLQGHTRVIGDVTRAAPPSLSKSGEFDRSPAHA